MAKRVKRKYQELTPDEKEEFDYLISLRDEIKRERERLTRVVACHRSRTDAERFAARQALNAFHSDEKKILSAQNKLTWGWKP